jgi:ribosome-associated protein
MVDIIKTVLEDKKGININVIDVSKSSIGADFFIIAEGTSVTHVKALADNIDEKLKKDHNILPLHVEGYNTARWVLLDYRDVIVHLFHSDDRDNYELDDLWNDGAMKWREES